MLRIAINGNIFAFNTYFRFFIRFCEFRPRWVWNKLYGKSRHSNYNSMLC